ncbi:MAG: DUF6088 family protein [Alkalispirochaeta sp.]
MQSITQKILSRIYGSGRGWCFSQVDFTDLASRSAVDSALKRLASTGTIRRILRGLYDYPTYSDFLGEHLAPDMQQVVSALCRKHGWHVVPDGSTALHLLGLDTQVPARFRYLSSGPNREYVIGNTQLRFSHQKTQHTTIDDRFAATVVQAILALGQKSITDVHRRQIASLVGEHDVRRVVKKTRRVTSWVHDEILRIAEMTAHQQ